MRIEPKGVVAVLLSIVYPGVGHAYLREWLRAVGWLALSLLTVYVLVPAGTLNTYEHALAAGDFSVLATASMPLDAALAVLVVRVCNAADAYVLAVRNARSTAPQAADAAPTCPSCGRELDTELDFCPWCTTELEWSDGREE